MVSNFHVNSQSRWFFSGGIALALHLLLLLFFIRKHESSHPIKPPIIKLEFLVARPDEIPEVPNVNPAPKVNSVQPKNVQTEQVHETVSEKPVTDNIASKVPEKSIATELSAPVSEPAKQQSAQSGNGQSLDAIQRIEGTASLDNTEFVPLFNPAPDYPAVAQASQITGYVDVDLIIGAEGKIESFTIIETKGHPSFATETAKVLPRWRFPPPRIGGKKVRVQYTYRVNFTLN